MRSWLMVLVFSMLCRPASAGSGAHGEEIDGYVRSSIVGRPLVSYCTVRDESGVSADEARWAIETTVREWREQSLVRGNPWIERDFVRFRLKLQYPNGDSVWIPVDTELVEGCWDHTAQVQFRFTAW